MDIARADKQLLESSRAESGVTITKRVSSYTWFGYVGLETTNPELALCLSSLVCISSSQPDLRSAPRNHELAMGCVRFVPSGRAVRWLLSPD